MDIKKWIGYEDASKTLEYTYRNVVLCNLAFGAKSDDMMHLFSKHENFKANPAFALVAAFGGDTTPRSVSTGIPSMEIQKEAAGGELEKGVSLGLDWDHDLYIYRPLEAFKGTFMFHNVVDHIYDRGPEKGCVISNAQTLYDEAGRAVAKNYTRTALFAEGGFGGDPLPKNEAVFPDREPDFVVDEFIDDKMYILYTIVGGGQTEIHIDEKWCQEVAHQPGVVIQGHLTLGNACRIAIDQVIPGQDERMRRIYAQFRNPLFPNTNIQFRGWKVDEGKMYFKVVNLDDHDKVILNNCIFEWA